jgi:F-type H+-transporting ATPase subunit epsilon
VASEAPTADHPDVVAHKALFVEMRSPDGPIWSGLASRITVPGAKGSFGVHVRHAPLMTSLEVGLTKITAADGAEHRFVTGLGFAEVYKNAVLLLVDFGDDTEGIDVERAREARARAEAHMHTREENFDGARAEAALQRALMRLRHAGTPRA